MKYLSKILLLLVLFSAIEKSVNSAISALKIGSLQRNETTPRSQIVYLKERIDAEFDCKPESLKICYQKLTSSHPLEFEFIKEDNFIYFFTSSNLPLNLTVIMRYKIDESIEKKSEQTIKISNRDLINRLEFYINKPSIQYFLSKENQLVSYFNERLNNTNATIASVKFIHQWIRLEMGSRTGWSKKTIDFINNTCAFENELSSHNKQHLASSVSKSFFNHTGLEIVQCSFNLYTFNPTSFYQPNNEVELFISLTSNSVILRVSFFTFSILMLNLLKKFFEIF